MERDEPALGPIEQFVVDDTDPLLNSAATRRDLRNLANRIDSQFVLLDSRLTGQIMQLDTKIDALEEKLDAKIDALDRKFEAKFDALGQKFEAKYDAFSQKFEAKFDALDQKIDIINLSLRESIESLATRGNREFIGVIIGFIGMIIAIVAVG